MAKKTLDLTKVKFSASSPELVELEVKRHQNVDTTQGGTFLIDCTLMFEKGDDTSAKAILKLSIDGSSSDGENRYFEMHITVESEIAFPEPITSHLEDSVEFAQIVQELMVGRTFPMVEHLSWSMGYKGISINLDMPRGNIMKRIKQS